MATELLVISSDIPLQIIEVIFDRSISQARDSKLLNFGARTDYRKASMIPMTTKFALTIDEEQIWDAEMEAAFGEATSLYPSCGKQKIVINGGYYGA